MCFNPLPDGKMGRPPKYCADHRDPKNRARDARIAAAQATTPAEAHAAATIAARATGASAPRPPSGEYSRRLRYAVALGAAAGDPTAAAELAGMAGSPDLATLAEAARTEHPEIVSGSRVGLGSLAMRLLQMGLVRLLDELPTMPATQLPGVLKALSEIRKETGDDVPVAATISVVLRRDGN